MSSGDAETLEEWSRRYGLLILPGCEVNTEEGHLLVYGLDRYVFGMHKAPFVREMVDRKGGAIVVSHPYRRRYRPSEGDALAAKSSGERVFGLADSIEVLNGRGSEERERLLAGAGPCHLGTPGTGASDAHREADIGTYATEFSRPVRDLGDLVEELRAGRFRAVDAWRGAGMTTLLEVQDLHVQFPTEEGVVKAVNGASLTLEEGQVLGVVGETGAGKTMTALAILRLLPFPGKVVQGEVRFAGRRLADLSEEQMQDLRGQEIAIVFQDASAALNPILTIGTQMIEAFRAHSDVSAEAARDRSAAMLEEMGLPDPYHLLERFPFQLSGGMAQRVMLAMAMSLRPRTADCGRADVEPGRDAAGGDPAPAAAAAEGAGGIDPPHHARPGGHRADGGQGGGDVCGRGDGGCRRPRSVPKPGASVHVGAPTGPASHGPRRAHAAGHSRRAAGPGGPAGPVPVHPALPQGDGRVPNQPTPPSDGDSGGPLAGVLQPRPGVSGRAGGGPG